jgi:hypothetical protein
LPINAVLKAIIIGLLPIAIAATLLIISAITAIWKSHLLRKRLLQEFPNLKHEISIRWIFYHAYLDAFFVQKSTLHRELK